MRNIIRNSIYFMIIVGSMLMAQGITLPNSGNAPAQAPIGGLGWLAVLGGALAYKKLRKK